MLRIARLRQQRSGGHLLLTATIAGLAGLMASLRPIRRVPEVFVQFT